MSMLGGIRKMLFGISLEETTFARRGFEPADPHVQAHLEQVAGAFVRGYHAALAVTDPERLGGKLNEEGPLCRGFAYEGAGMGLALLDGMAPFSRSRWEAFVAGPAEPHAYMMYVGAGWAAARIPWLRRNIGSPPAGRDPLLRWLALDGYGFHEGFFHTADRLDRQQVPKQLEGYARRAFDQGLGRSLWFVKGADTSRIVATIDGFPPERKADLYGGVGLACAYAGGAKRDAIESLCAVDADYRWHLAQGAAFAAKARLRAGNMVPHTELACDVLCRLSAAEAAKVTDECLDDLPPDDATPAYERWRQRIRKELTPRQVGAGIR